MGQFEVLKFLKLNRNVGFRVVDIAKSLGVCESSVGVAVRKLLKVGWVKRKECVNPSSRLPIVLYYVGRVRSVGLVSVGALDKFVREVRL